METWEWIVLVAGLAVLVILALALVRIRQRRAHLKDRFGPEYQRAVAGAGTGSAERRLTEAERVHDELEVRELPSAARQRYLDEWRQAEARFVSDPRDAARAAERLVERLLVERGCPEDSDLEHRMALVAVDHPDAVEHYRRGHGLIEQDRVESTENLRRAMVDLRTVLEDLLQRERTAA
jgi:uncharacterized protein YciW